MFSLSNLLRPVLVGMLAMFAFSSVVPGGGWVFDDHVLLERNRDLRRDDVWVESFKRDYYASSEGIGQSGYYRPVTVLTHAVDMRMWQDAARGSHLTNLVLHTLASLLLPMALMALGVASIAAWATAAFFAAHPVHAESVAFVSGRVDVVAAIFMWAALACAARRGIGAALGVGACTLLAFLSKEIAFVTPLLLVLVWRREAARNRWAPSWPRAQVLAVVVAIVAVVVLRLQALDSFVPTTAHQARDTGVTLLPAKTLVFALASVFAPLRQICMEPDPRHLDGLRLTAGFLLAVAVWGTALWRLRPRAPLVRSAIAAAVSMLLFLNLLRQETLLSERFLYLASGFLLVPLGAWWARGWERARAARAVVLVAGVVVLGWLMLVSTWRGQVWRTDVTVWRQAVQEEPERAAFWDRLGLALTERRSYNEAEVALQRAVSLDPHNANALHNMGVLLQATRRPQAAAVFYRRALQLLPGNPRTRLNLGQVLLATQQYEAALEQFQTVIQLKPDLLPAHRLAVTTALSAGRADLARQHLRAAQRLWPQEPSLRQLEIKIQRLESRPAPGAPPEQGRN